MNSTSSNPYQSVEMNDNPSAIFPAYGGITGIIFQLNI